MRRVPRGDTSTLAACGKKIGELCDASDQVTEEIADAYTVTVPTGFVPVRTLDLTANPTAATVAAVLATLLLDMKQRGTTRRTAGV